MRESAQVIERPGLLWTAGAPSPMVMTSERRTLFSFDASGDEVAYRRVAEFVNCTSVRFGFPNDEAQGGHPLYGRGLGFYSAHEVHESSWLAELHEIERKHPRAAQVPFPAARHFLLTFHDSMLEAIAQDVLVLGAYESEAAAEEAMLALLRDG